VRLGCIVWRLPRVACRCISYLVGVPTGLRPSLNIILDLLLLFLVGVSNLDALRNLCLLGPVQRIESCPLSPVLGSRSFSTIVRIGVDVGIVHSIARSTLRGAGSWSSLSDHPSLALASGRRIVLIRIIHRLLSHKLVLGVPLVLLLLMDHLLLNLLLVKLLRWSQIKVINYVGDIGHSILLGLRTLHNHSFLVGKTILNLSV
jgi:hypothetical protein